MVSTCLHDLRSQTFPYSWFHSRIAEVKPANVLLSRRETTTVDNSSRLCMLAKPHAYTEKSTLWLASKTLPAGMTWYTCTCHWLVIHMFSKEIMPHQIGRFRNRQACRSRHTQSAHSCWHVWIPVGIKPSHLWIPVVICGAGCSPSQMVLLD